MPAKTGGGAPISFKQAATRGLINEAAPRAQVMERARAMAREFAAKSPVVMKLARDSFMRANDFEYRRNIENVVETICNIIETDDAQEGFTPLPQLRDVPADGTATDAAFLSPAIIPTAGRFPAGCCCVGVNCPP